MLERDGRGAAEHRTKVESMSGTAHESPVAKNAGKFLGSSSQILFVIWSIYYKS